MLPHGNRRAGSGAWAGQPVKDDVVAGKRLPGRQFRMAEEVAHEHRIRGPRDEAAGGMSQAVQLDRAQAGLLARQLVASAQGAGVDAPAEAVDDHVVVRGGEVIAVEQPVECVVGWLGQRHPAGVAARGEGLLVGRQCAADDQHAIGEVDVCQAERDQLPHAHARVEEDAEGVGITTILPGTGRDLIGGDARAGWTVQALCRSPTDRGSYGLIGSKLAVAPETLICACGTFATGVCTRCQTPTCSQHRWSVSEYELLCKDCFPHCHCGLQAQHCCDVCQTWFCANHGRHAPVYLEYINGERHISRWESVCAACAAQAVVERNHEQAKLESTVPAFLAAMRMRGNPGATTYDVYTRGLSYTGSHLLRSVAAWPVGTSEEVDYSQQSYPRRQVTWFLGTDGFIYRGALAPRRRRFRRPEYVASLEPTDERASQYAGKLRAIAATHGIDV